MQCLVTVASASHSGLALQHIEGCSFRCSQSSFPKSHCHREHAHTWNGSLPEAQLEKAYHIPFVPGIIRVLSGEKQWSVHLNRLSLATETKIKKAKFRWPHSEQSRNQGSSNTLWPGSAFTVGFTHIPIVYYD